MSHNRILTIDDCRIVTAFIKHSHIDTENIGKINGAVHRSLIRADDHKVIFIGDKIRNGAKQRFHKLVRRIEAVKSA